MVLMSTGPRVKYMPVNLRCEHICCILFACCLFKDRCIVMRTQIMVNEAALVSHLFCLTLVTEAMGNMVPPATKFIHSQELTLYFLRGTATLLIA